MVSKVGTNNIIFEPTIENYNNECKDPDICIKLNYIETIIECKTIDSEKIFEYLDEHKCLANLLDKWLIKIPSNYEKIQIIYKDSFSDIDVVKLWKLCENLNNRIPSITGEGEIYNDNLFEVEIFIRNLDEENTSEIIHIESEKMSKIIPSYLKEGEQCRIYHNNVEGFTALIYGTTLVMSENYIYPQSTFFGKNVLVILGPRKVDYTSILENKIKKAREQAPKNKPYVLAINMTDELGNIDENRNIIKNLFQKGYNSRYSGVLPIKIYFDEFNFDPFIPNPFHNELASKEFNSISDKFKALFR